MKKGISFILLIITIIIMIIIASVVIYSLNQDGIIEMAIKAKEANNISAIKENLQIEYMDLVENINLKEKRDVVFDDFLDFKDTKIEVLTDEDNKVLVNIDENEKEYAAITYEEYSFRMYIDGSVVNVSNDGSVNDDDNTEEDTETRVETPYTTDGLVMRLSGYNNTGNGHDNSANVWKDISGVSNVEANIHKGDAIWGDNSITLDGSTCWRMASPVYSNGFGTVEIALSIDSNFSPVQYSGWYPYWYNASCIFGCEISGTQREVALIINSGGKFAIGYSGDTIVNTNINALDGNIHTLSYYYGSNKIVFSIDGQQVTTVNYTPSGNIPVTYGIGWNNSSDTTKIKGKIYEIRYYDDELTPEEITSNYNADKDNIVEDLPEKDVINLINNVGTVNQNSGYLLNLIEKKYNGLESESKNNVSNYDKYTTAKSTFETITKNYENDGLVMKLLGEDNTGSGYSSSAETWKDLKRDNVVATKTAGNTLWQDNNLRLDGSTYWNIASPVSSDGFGTVEIALSIDSNFSPVQYSGWYPYWYNASCIFGCEISGTQRDFALIISSGGKFGIGYSSSTIQSTGINALDGNVHTLSYYYGSNKIIFSIDGQQIIVIDYTPGGNIPATYGIGWNNSSSTTKIKGNIYSVRFYNKKLSLDEIYKNYLVDKGKYDN